VNVTGDNAYVGLSLSNYDGGQSTFPNGQDISFAAYYECMIIINFSITYISGFGWWVKKDQQAQEKDSKRDATLAADQPEDNTREDPFADYRDRMRKIPSQTNPDK
jgi:hypothetical protein